LRFNRKLLRFIVERKRQEELITFLTSYRITTFFFLLIPFLYKDAPNLAPVSVACPEGIEGLRLFSPTLPE
jgi:hypothetical protein